MAQREETALVKVVLNNKEAREHIAELTSDLKRLKAAKDDAIKAGNTTQADKLDKDIARARTELRQYKSAVVDVDHVLRTLNRVPLEDLRRAQKQLRKEIQYLDRDTKEYALTLEKLNRVQREVNRQGAQVSRSGGRLGTALKDMLPMASLAALPYMLKMLMAPFTQFQWMMAKVGSVSGASREEFRQLRAEAQRLGASTEYTATQVAELQLNYARLGFVPAQILSITAATLDLATATGSDLATSADVAGSTLRGFGLDATQMLRVVDVMASSFNKSALDLGTFAEAMKYVAPVAAQANITLEQTTAMLGILADRGIRGSQAGTSLKRILTEVSISGKSVSEALADLNEKGLTLAGAEDEVGRYAMTALTVLAGNAASIESLNTALVDSAGTAARTAATMRDNIRGDMDTLKSKLEGIAIWLGDVLNPVIRGTIQLFTWLLTPLQHLAVAVGSYLAVTKGWMLIQKGWNIVLAAKNGILASSIIQIKTMTAEEIKSAIAQRASMAASHLLAAAKLLLAGNTRAAATAFKLFWASIGPIGWIVLAVSAAATAMALFSSRTKEAATAGATLALELSQERDTYSDLRQAIERSTMGSKARAETINIINERYKDLLPNMLTEAMSNEQITTTLDGLNDRMQENIKIRIKADEMQRIQKEQMDVEYKALTKLMELYNSAAERTPAQSALATQSFADLIINLRQTGDRAQYTAGVVEILGLNMQTMNAAMTTNLDYGPQYNRAMGALRTTLFAVTEAARKTGGQMQALNALIGAGADSNTQYAEYSRERLDSSLRQINGTLSANVMLTRQGRAQLLLQRDAITKEIAQREQQIRQESTYAKTLERLRGQKKALEDQRGTTAAADKKEIARINKLIKAKESEIALLAGNKTGAREQQPRPWSLSGDTDYIQACRALREELHSGQIASETEYARRLLELEIQTLQGRIAAGKEQGAEMAALRSEMAEKIYQQTKASQARLQKLIEATGDAGTDTDKENEAYEKRLRDLGLFARQRAEMTTGELDALDAIERQHTQKLSAIYVDELSREITALQKAIERKATETQQANADELGRATTFEQKKDLLRRWFSDAEIRRVRTDNEADTLLKAQYAKQEQDAMRDDLQRMLSIYEDVSQEIGRTGLLESGVAATEQDKEKILQIMADLKEKIARAGGVTMPTPGVTDTGAKYDVLGMSVERWSALAQHLRDGTAGAQEMLAVAQAIGNAFGQVSDVISAMEEREFKEYTRTQDKKKRALERQLKANTISQERYSEAVQRIDQQTEQKREEMEQQQARRNKMLAIFQAAVNTAVAITSALGAPPPMNIILPAIIGALGAAQIVTIAATPLPGKEQGGFVEVDRAQDGRRFHAAVEPDKRGPVNIPTVLVAENGTEYVVPAEGFQNPTIRPVLEIMERARKNGTIANINLPAAMLGAGHVGGRAAGGYISDDTGGESTARGDGMDGDTSTQGPQMVAMMQRLDNTIEQLLHRLETPIRAEVPLLGTKGIRAAQEKYNRIRKQSGI